MNKIKNKSPVVVNVNVSHERAERYSFYTPAFIVEDDAHERSLEVFSLDDLVKNGYDVDSPAYIYCALAFAQEQRVDSIYIISKKTTESYLDAFIASPYNKFYFISTDSVNEDDIIEISDHLTRYSIRKLLFISKYTDISAKLIGRRNIVWLWKTEFWFWDSSAIVVWDSNLDVELAIRQYPESAWISRCGSLFPSQVQWSCKELVAVSTQDYFTPQQGVDYDMTDHTEPPFTTPSNWYENIMDYDVTWGDGTTCNGEWVDNVVFDDWMVWAIQRNIWKLFKISPKVNTTSDGLDKIESKLKEVLDFGIEQDGILTYKITESKFDRLTRKCSFKFNYTRLHAIIGVVSIDGTVNY